MKLAAVWSSVLLATATNAATRQFTTGVCGDREGCAGDGVCSAATPCRCECSSAIDVFFFQGTGTTARARANVGKVLGYPGSGIRVHNHTDNGDVASMLRYPEYDVIVFPGGGGHTEQHAIGADGAAAVKEFLRRGGGYVGICAGAFLADDLLITAWHDAPHPAKGVRGDGNCTLAVAANTSKYPLPAADRVTAQPFFYANGPVMVLKHPAPPNVTSATALLHYTSPSVPIEKNYTGPYAGGGYVALGLSVYAGAGRVVVSGPHPETNEMDFPRLDGPPSAPGGNRAALLQSYVKIAAGKDV